MPVNARCVPAGMWTRQAPCGQRFKDLIRKDRALSGKWNGANQPKQRTITGMGWGFGTNVGGSVKERVNGRLWLETITEELAGDAEAPGGGGDVLIGFAQGVGDEFIDHLVEDETFLGESPGGIAPGGGGRGDEAG